MRVDPQQPTLMIGRVIADYELTAYIGAGATGVVYRGQRTSAAPDAVETAGSVPREFPEEAAIKLLVPPLGATQDDMEDFQQRFLREASMLKQINHPHILPVVDFGQDTASGIFYMILPYMAGGSLANVIATRGPLPLAETSSILAQIADALDYAHSKGVVHVDVKPGNILLDVNGAPFLSDFSIARLLSEGTTMRTTTGRMMGTPAYMAPEQFDDSSKVGAAADTYGLGMVAYELITGRAAFSSTSWAQVMKQQLQDMPTLPGATRPDLPKPAEAAIMQALAKEPAQRFSTAAAFAQAFAQGLQGMWSAGLLPSIAPLSASTETMTVSVYPSPGFPASSRGRGFFLRLFSRDHSEEVWSSHDEINHPAAYTIPQQSTKQRVKPLTTLEQVAFSAYYPKEVEPQRSMPLLVYLAVDEAGALAQVAALAAERLKGRLDQYRPKMASERIALRRGTRLRVAPVIPGFRVNPQWMDVTWDENAQQHEFSLCAETAPEDRATAGVVRIYQGLTLRAEIPLSIFVAQKVSASLTPDDFARAVARAYRKVFASYSHRDMPVVKSCEATAHVMGDRYLRDVMTLRSGQLWNEQLKSMIVEADVFQLFWSRNAARSLFVRQEWEYALTLQANREGFIRPVYWTSMPHPIPPELVSLHFAPLSLTALGWGIVRRTLYSLHTG